MPYLVNDLEALLNAIEGIGSEWRQNFLHLWGTFEDARATVLFRESELLNEEKIIVNTAVLRLKAMVVEKLDSLDA